MSSWILENLGDLGIETVTIHVGPVESSKTFVIHKKLICEKVDFFNKAFIGGFKENEGIMTLHDDKPAMFSLFVTWLYRSDVATAVNNEGYANLCKLYIFAERICHTDLADAIMDSIRLSAYYHHPDVCISIALAAFIYKGTAPGSPLRRYCVQELGYRLWTGTGDSSIPAPDKLAAMHTHWHDCENLFVDYFTLLRANPLRLHDWPWVDAPDGFAVCNFHAHKEDEVCPSASRTFDDDREGNSYRDEQDSRDESLMFED